MTAHRTSAPSETQTPTQPTSATAIASAGDAPARKDASNAHTPPEPPIDYCEPYSSRRRRTAPLVSEPVSDREFCAWFDSHEVAVPNLGLDAIIGLPAAKRELESLIVRLRNPELFLAMGASLPRGILAYGPPGCGKTLMARVLAGMLGASSEVAGAEGSANGDPSGPESKSATNGSGVRFLEFSASELSPERLIAWQRNLPSSADGRYMVVFIDEIDLIGKSRDNEQHNESTLASLFALLSVLDGLRAHDRVVFIAATNTDPTYLDSALVRAGRFGFKVAVTTPTSSERKALFAHYLIGRRLAEPIDPHEAAERAGLHTTPADVRQMLDDGAALSMADGHDGMTKAALFEAIKRRGEVEREAPAPTEEAIRSVAVHESGHALIGALVGRPPTGINTDKRDGAVTFREDEDDVRSFVSGEEALDHIAIALAGLEAEQLVFGLSGVYLGNKTDLQSATSLVMARLENGMDPAYPAIGRSPFGNGFGHPSGREADDAYLAARATISAQQDRVSRMLVANRDKLDRLAEIVFTERILGAARLVEVFRELGFAITDKQKEQLQAAEAAAKAEAEEAPVED